MATPRTNGAPKLDNDPPPIPDAQSLAVVRRPNNILDRNMSGFLKDFDEVHAGGALPNLFPDDAKKGDYEIVRYLGHEIVLNEGKKKGNKTFASLRFEVLDEETGKVIHKAQQVCNTVLMDYFGIPTDGDDEIPYNPATMQVVAPDAWKKEGKTVRDPAKTPLLALIYLGEGQQGVSGFSKPKLFAVTELIPKGKKK